MPIPGDADGSRHGRHSRQLRLAEIGPEGQRRLAESSVLIVGLGGLGSPAALYLAGAGVGTIALCDFDKVDRSNLHRQPLYGDADVGRKKVDVAAARLRALNPDIKVLLHEAQVTAANALNLVRGFDLVLDGTDDLAAKLALNAACQQARVPLVFGAVTAWEGQVALFEPGGPCYRCAFPNPEEGPSCADEGVLGTVPGIVGTMQAQEAIKRLLGLPGLAGALWVFDARDASTRTITLKRRPGCECTVKQPVACPAPWAMPAAPAIDAPDLMARPDAFILDVREADEYGEAHIPGSRLVPLHHLTERLADLPRDRTIVCVCSVGGRSARATGILREHGFDAVNLRGGMRAWFAAGGAVLSGEP